MQEGKTGSGSATQLPQAIQDQLREVSRNPTDYLNFFRQVCGSARIAGVTEQQLLDNIHTWYNEGGTGSGSGSSSGR